MSTLHHWFRLYCFDIASFHCHQQDLSFLYISVNLNWHDIYRVIAIIYHMLYMRYTLCSDKKRNNSLYFMYFMICLKIICIWFRWDFLCRSTSMQNNNVTVLMKSLTAQLYHFLTVLVKCYWIQQWLLCKNIWKYARLRMCNHLNIW